MLPRGARTSPRLADLAEVRPGPGYGHHAVIAGYDLDRQTIRAERRAPPRALRVSDSGLPAGLGGVGAARGRPFRRNLSILRGLDGGPVAQAADRRQESSNLFRKLRHEERLTAAGDLPSRIADSELAALDLMERAWPEVRALG